VIYAGLRKIRCGSNAILAASQLYVRADKMNFSEIRSFLNNCINAYDSQIRWCGEKRFNEENMLDLSPGGHLNVYNYYVVGTTIGGNAIVISQDDPRVCFADHTWYSDDLLHYEDIGGDGEWHELPMNHENVKKSLHTLALTREKFLALLKAGAIESELDRID